jgi:hypothetical protein
MTWWRKRKPIGGYRTKEEEMNIKCTMHFVKVATNYRD